MGDDGFAPGNNETALNDTDNTDLSGEQNPTSMRAETAYETTETETVAVSNPVSQKTDHQVERLNHRNRERIIFSDNYGVKQHPV
ncbi:MAG: hypothetical protein JRH15_20880, partial [Deltaproteobacteria bacterium]|nr:hypothetical protein [Deltaproteobacteria bacterium]